MFNKVRNCMADVFYYMSTFFTIFMFIEVIIRVLNGNENYRIESILISFFISLVISVVCYIIWNTNLLNFNYKVKRTIQYLFGLGLMIVFNLPITFTKLIFIFVYYNFLYIALTYIYFSKEKRDADKLNKVIQRLKEKDHE